MEEQELLKWIDEQFSSTGSILSHLGMNAQLMPLSEMEEKAYRVAERQLVILNELKMIVVNWYQIGEDMKEGQGNVV